MNKDRVLEITQEEVGKIFQLIGISNEVEYSASEVGEDGGEKSVIINVSVKGEDLGFMIGNHGRHLQSLQTLVTMVVRNIVRKEDENLRLVVLVDVGGYREQQNDRVERIAMQRADDARILGEPVDLMPMSASERRVVHTSLGRFDDIKTESYGEGRDRYVRITPISEKDLGIVSQTEDNADNEEEAQE